MAKKRVVYQPESKQSRNTWTLDKADNYAALAENIARPLAEAHGERGAAVSRETERTFTPRTGTYTVSVKLAYASGLVLSVDMQTDRVTIIKRGKV